MTTSESIVGVVADANVLLSAAIGKAALRVFTDHDIEVHACRCNCDEVEEYLPHMAAKYQLTAELVAMQWRLLPIEVHEEADYHTHLAGARKKLAKRDPDDAHPLALALSLHLPLWSNDRDLGRHSVACHSTAVLLKLLDSGR